MCEVATERFKLGPFEEIENGQKMEVSCMRSPFPKKMTHSPVACHPSCSKLKPYLQAGQSPSPLPLLPYASASQDCCSPMVPLIVCLLQASADAGGLAKTCTFYFI